jgi:hypothetical protein
VYIHFILEGLLPLLPTNKSLDLASSLAVTNVDKLVHLLTILVRKDTGLLQENLSVVAVGVPPLKVLVRGLLQVHFHVLKGVLLDVSNTQVGMLLYLSAGRDDLSGKKLDESGLASTVRSNDGNS